MFPSLFPAPPSAQVDWDDLDSARYAEASCHIEVRYQAAEARWAEPVLVRRGASDTTTTAAAPLSGPQCSEALVAVRHVTPWGDRLVVFRPDLHAARMAWAAATECMPAPPPELFTECVRRAVAANAELVPPAESDGFLSARAVLARLPGGDAVLSVRVRPGALGCDAAARDALLVEDDAEGGGGLRIRGVDGQPSAGDALLGLCVEDDGWRTLLVAEAGSGMASPLADALVRLAERGGGVQARRCTASELAASLPHLSEAVAVVGSDTVVPVRTVARQSTGDSFSLPDGGSLMDLAQHLLGIVRGVRGDAEGWCCEVRATDAELAALAREYDEGQRAALPSMIPDALQSRLSALGAAVGGFYPGALLGMLAFMSHPAPCAAREC